MAEEGQPKNHLELIQEQIENAGSLIEAEFARSGNTWIECLVTRVATIELRLSLSERSVLPSGERLTKARAKLEWLKSRIPELRKEYPAKESILSDNVKQELISALDILAE